MPSHQPSKSAVILEYNITNSLNLLSDNNEEDIGLKASNNGNKRTKLRSVDNTGSNNNNNIDQ